jgi:two-component system nitrogen regulation sensor histidine kinase NtrY
MVYRNYNFWLVLRIIILLVNVFLTGSSFLMIGMRDLLFLPLILSFVLIIQVVEMVFYLQRMSREIARFVNNLSHQDLSEKFDENSVGPPFKSLYNSLNKVVSQLEEIKIEKEAQFSYLQVILSHITTGIISLREDGKIVLLNDSAKELLGIADSARWTDVEENHPGLVSALHDIKGRGNSLVGDLSVNKSSVKILGTGYTIITLHDIRTEIEQKEIEAWHKLIQILRHEIRNSVTPIASMSETILMMVEDQAGNAKKPGDLAEKDMEDIHSSIRTVQGRSEKLYKFVEKYRQLTRLPPPQKETILVGNVINDITGLFRKETEDLGITMQSEPVDGIMSIDADPSLIEQVLINLIKNSIHAIEGIEGGKIRILASETKRNIIISVEDNGPGIDPAAIQDIFLPFYTTREEGMGVGLSLSRQIMNLHGGTLTVQSKEAGLQDHQDISTIFNMVFMK